MIRRAAILALGATLLAPVATLPAGASDLRQRLRDLADETRPAPSTTAPSADDYRDKIDRDLSAIDRAAGVLFDRQGDGFGPRDGAQVIAFFTRPDCTECDAAEAELKTLARREGVFVRRLDITRHAALADRLGLDMAPSYVLPRMMLRGHLPPVVLERYLGRG